MVDSETIRTLLAEIRDPELPALNIVELGIVRDVEVDASSTTVTITPTYSGCPAMAVIERSIAEHLRQAGITNVSVRTALSPAWTSDWISEEGRRKLREYGIAPPHTTAADAQIVPMPKRLICPFCGSNETELRSEFGATACKALYFCRNCVQPFEYLKAI